MRLFKAKTSVSEWISMLLVVGLNYNIENHTLMLLLINEQ